MKLKWSARPRHTLLIVLSSYQMVLSYPFVALMAYPLLGQQFPMYYISLFKYYTDVKFHLEYFCTRVISAILDSWNLLILTNLASSGSKKYPISVVGFRSITIFFNLKICIFVFNYNIFIYFVNRKDIILLPFHCILTTTKRYVKTNKFHPPVINNDVMLKIKESI